MKKVDYQLNEYHVIAEFTVEEILNLIDPKNTDRTRIKYKGFEFRISSLRLRTFKKHGVKCACCGKEGIIFRLQNSGNSNFYHLGLWTADNIQMTKDHVIPKSKGGKDRLDNMQTLCQKCNNKKANKIIKYVA